MDFHVITPAGPALVAQVEDGKLVAPAQAGTPAAAAQAQPAPGK